MLFVIHALDKPEHEAVRKANVDAHVAYLRTSSVKLVLAGPLMAEEVAAPIGSLLIVEARSLEEVRRFSADDPYTKAGLFADVRIAPFKKTMGWISEDS